MGVGGVSRRWVGRECGQSGVADQKDVEVAREVLVTRRCAAKAHVGRVAGEQNVPDAVLLQKLLERLVRNGLAALPTERLGELAEYLEGRAVETGLGAPIFVSQAIRAVEHLVDQDDNLGGVRTKFLAQLDGLFRSRVPIIQSGDPLKATAEARALRDEVASRVAKYDAALTYD